MKTLKEYIVESESSVAKFLKDNYKGKFKISSTPNSDGLYEVSSTGKVELKNFDIESLTNGEFIFTDCKWFVIEEAENLENLEGFPQNVKDQVILSFLNITDLTGMPEQLRNEVNKQKDKLRGMMDAYQDIANEIAYQEGFEMPAFDCCKGK